GLGNWTDHTNHVCFLKSKLANLSVAFLLVGIDLPSDENGRTGIKVAASYTRQQIHCTRSAGGHCDARYPCEAPHCVGGECSALFVPHADDRYLPLCCNRIQHDGNHAAGKLEHRRHTPGLQKTGQVLRNFDLFHEIQLSASIRSWTRLPGFHWVSATHR